MERQWFNGKVKCLLGVVAWLTSNCLMHLFAPIVRLL